MDVSERSEESDSGCTAPSPSGSAPSSLYRVPVATGDPRPGFEQGRQGAQPRPEPGVCEVAANEAAEDAPEEAAVAEDGHVGAGRVVKDVLKLVRERQLRHDLGVDRRLVGSQAVRLSRQVRAQGVGGEL